jgi:hypothetical protein
VFKAVFLFYRFLTSRLISRYKGCNNSRVLLENSLSLSKGEHTIEAQGKPSEDAQAGNELMNKCAPNTNSLLRNHMCVFGKSHHHDTIQYHRGSMNSGTKLTKFVTNYPKPDVIILIHGGSG